jgi:hypothetical protein
LLVLNLELLPLESVDENMNSAFSEILLGVKRSIGLLSQKEQRSLMIATFIMLITGILTNGPAVILGKLVD